MIELQCGKSRNYNAEKAARNYNADYTAPRDSSKYFERPLKHLYLHYNYFRYG